MVKSGIHSIFFNPKKNTKASGKPSFTIGFHSGEIFRLHSLPAKSKKKWNTNVNQYDVIIPQLK